VVNLTIDAAEAPTAVAWRDAIHTDGEPCP
jgi:hypothetical protein